MTRMLRFNPDHPHPERDMQARDIVAAVPTCCTRESDVQEVERTWVLTV